MDRRTKILAGLFGLAIAYLVFDRVVYPVWIEPLLTIDEHIETEREALLRLEATEKQVATARVKYRNWARRVGSFDEGKVETSARAKLTELINRHELTGRRVSTTGRTKDKKTGISRMTITVKATGTLEHAIGFLEDVRDLPHLAQVGNVKLSPQSSRTAKVPPGQEQMNLTVPVEVWVLPQQKIVGHITEEELTHPFEFVDHEDLDYSTIWKATPFSEWVPPVPLFARAGPAVNVKPGVRVSLKGTVRGGLKPYKVQWSPSEGLSDATQLNPTVDTATVVLRVYTLTVTDGMGSTATDRVTVNVKEPPAIAKLPDKPKNARVPPPPPPLPQGPKRWKDGRSRQIRSILISHSPSGGISELMLYHGRSKQTEYFAVGSEFDGGELVFMHPTGAVVRRKSGRSQVPEFVIYPIGAMCDEDIPVSDARATEYPQLALAATHLREADEKAAQEKAAEEKTAQEQPVEEKAETSKATGKVDMVNTAPSEALGADRRDAAGQKPAKGVGKKPGERAKRGAAVDPGKRGRKPAAVRKRPTASEQAALRVRQYQRQKHGRRPPR